jgi:cytochrome c oxidase subunit 2
MDKGFQWWPDQASSVAGKVDALYAFLIVVTVFFTVLIFAAIVFLALKYRRRPGVKPQVVHTSHALELTWTIIPFVLTMVMFFWSAGLYVHMQRAPDDAMQINVVGKQWMWKIQHPTGKREINELHVPKDRPIRLVMTSQDVIHSFYLPSFRVKQDVLPGRYTSEWFTATKVGEYHLFCAEYCGTQHSGMIGKVIVMEPTEYQAWLAGTPSDESPAAAGAKLFTQFQCFTCHGQRGPGLAGLYGSKVKLADGSTVTADDDYLRESILSPNAKIVSGFQALMPTYAAQLTEEQVMDLVSYIKSLRTEGAPQQSSPAQAPAGSKR